MFLVGVMNGGGGFEYDFEHERHEREEKKFTLILLLGGLFEESVELIGREESLEDGAYKNGEGGFLFDMSNINSNVAKLRSAIHRSFFSTGGSISWNNDRSWA